MSEYDFSCLIIRRDSEQQQSLLKVLRSCYSNVRINLVSDVRTLKVLLQRPPTLLFYIMPEEKSGALAVVEQKLLRLIQHHCSDCIFVRLSRFSWRGLYKINPLDHQHRTIATDSCMLATDSLIRLQQELNDLFVFAGLKAEFRQCKRLLNISEKRSHWLAEQAREAVAYIAHDRFLYANIAYLSLFGLNAKQISRSKVAVWVHADDRDVFIAAKQEAEHSIKPSVKILLTFAHASGRSFRAEAGFIPAVYRGQRCLQLHVRPVATTDVLENNSTGAVGQQAAVKRDPWQEPAAGRSLTKLHPA